MRYIEASKASHLCRSKVLVKFLLLQWNAMTKVTNGRKSLFWLLQRVESVVVAGMTSGQHGGRSRKLGEQSHL